MIEWVILPTMISGGVVITVLVVLLLAERRRSACLEEERRPRSGESAFGALPLQGPDAIVRMAQAFWSEASPAMLAQFRAQAKSGVEALGGFQFEWVAPRPREVVERVGLLLAEHLRMRGLDRPFTAGPAYRLALQTGLLAAVAMAEAYEHERVPEKGGV